MKEPVATNPFTAALKRGVFILFSVFCSAALPAQEITSSLSVEVVDADPRDSLGAFFYPYKLRVTQDFDIRAIPGDTVVLQLENYSFFQTIRGKGEPNFALIPNMEVLVRSGDAPYRDAAYSFDGIAVRLLKGRDTHVRVNYGYYSDLCFRTNLFPGSCSLLQYDFGWNSWYFKAAGLPTTIEKARFGVPNQVELFINGESSVDCDGKVSLDMTRHRYDHISFYLADKRWYESHPFQVGGLQCNLLLCKRDTVMVGEEIPAMLPHLSENDVAQKQASLSQIFESLNRLFPESPIREFTVLEDDLETENEKYGFGRAVQISRHKSAVFFDRSFWGSPSLPHELVHCYLNYNYDKIDARYFFDEALVEYFANCLCYSDPVSRDEAFEEKMAYYDSLPGEKQHSIFDISRNFVDPASGEGTWGVIYYKVPCLIHRFVKQIGEDRFLAALRTFNRRLEQGFAPTFDEFGAILMESGVTEQAWTAFKQSL